MIRSNNVSLTTGPIGLSLIQFAIPFLGSSLIQQLYNTVDIIFVSQLVGTEAAAAVGSSSLIVTCIIGFFTGISMGIGILTAKAFARNDTVRLRELIHGSAGLTLALGLAFTVAAFIIAPWCLTALQTPRAIFSEALLYIRVYVLGLIPIVTYNIGAGVLRSLGNSKSPLVYQAIGGVVNVLGNALFIGFFQWGIFGAAMTTLCSQTVAAALIVFHLRRLRTPYALRWNQIRWSTSVASQVLRLGVPAAVQAIVITLSNLIVQGTINGLGIVSIAAFTAYFKVENIIYLPIMAMGQAYAVFVSQNMGLYDFERIGQGLRVTAKVGIGVTIALTAFVLGVGTTIFSWFATDDAVISLAVQIAWIAYPFYFIYMVLESFGSAIRGVGNTFAAMVITVVNMCGIRMVCLYAVMQLYPDPLGVAAVYPLTWASTAAMLGLYYWWWRRKQTVGAMVPESGIS